MSKKTKQNQNRPPDTNGVTRSPQSGDQHRTRWRLACILPAFTVLAASLLFPANRIHEDEIYWIGSSYYYPLAVVEGDASNPDWQLLPARENPVLGKYVIGLALQIAGHPVTTPDLLGSFYLIFANIPNAWGSGEAFEKRLNTCIFLLDIQYLDNECKFCDLDIRTLRLKAMSFSLQL